MIFKEGVIVYSDKHKEQKKIQMLEKCFELFVKQGLENTSMNDLAEYCGLHKATIYSYFKSKDEVVLESAKQYMETLENKLYRHATTLRPTIKEALKDGFQVFCDEKNNLRYIYQVISSPKYGEISRDSLKKIYNKYLDYSDVFADLYGLNKKEFRPYYLLLIGSLHDYSMWDNVEVVEEKLDYIFSRVESIAN